MAITVKILRVTAHRRVLQALAVRAINMQLACSFNGCRTIEIELPENEVPISLHRTCIIMKAKSKKANLVYDEEVTERIV